MLIYFALDLLYYLNMRFLVYYKFEKFSHYLSSLHKYREERESSILMVGEKMNYPQKNKN